MSLDTDRLSPEAAAAVDPELRTLERQGQLPSWATPAALGAAAVVVGGLLAITGFSVGLWAVGTVVVFAVGLYALSRVVEGRRKATDRLVTIVVTSAFLLALIPLLSVAVTVFTEGLHR